MVYKVEDSSLETGVSRVRSEISDGKMVGIEFRDAVSDKSVDPRSKNFTVGNVRCSGSCSIFRGFPLREIFMRVCSASGVIAEREEMLL